MRRQILLASGLLALATTAATAQEAVLLRVGGTVGQINKYQTVMNTFISGGPMAMVGGDTSQPTMRMTTFTTRTLTAVDGDTLTFQEVIDSARSESPGMPQMAAMMGNIGERMRGQATTTRLDGRARVFSTETANANAPGGMQGGGPGGPGGRGGRGGMGGLARNNQRAVYVLPERPVRVGETWSDSSVTPASGTEGATSFLASFRLERVDNRGSARVAVVSLDGNMVNSSPAGPQRFAVRGQLQLDLSAGRLASFDMTMTGTTSMGQGGDVPVRVVLTQSLIP